jgi:hypothetical protein
MKQKEYNDLVAHLSTLTGKSVKDLKTELTTVE